MAGPEDAVLTWTYAARAAAERLAHLGPRTRLYQIKADAGILIMALRNVLRGAEWLNSESGERNIIIPALERFRQMLPDLVAARNVLEHFDEYAVGNGHAQRRFDDPDATTPSYPVTFDFSDQGIADIKIGSLSICIADAYDACNMLLAFIYSRFLIGNWSGL